MAGSARPFTLIAMFVAGVACALLYSHTRRDVSSESAAPKKLATTSPESASRDTPAAGLRLAEASDENASDASVTSEPATEDASATSDSDEGAAPNDSEEHQTKVHEWVNAATSEDPDARTEAIAALAEAPKSDALPVLDRVLTAGSPEDRQLSLNSLRKLAQIQGDDDGTIRDTIQKAIYHGDSDEISANARRVLTDIQQDAQAPQ